MSASPPPSPPAITLQASEEASLRALESLMTEFFHNCTTNERKREIGTFLPREPIAAHQKQVFSGCVVSPSLFGVRAMQEFCTHTVSRKDGG